MRLAMWLGVALLLSSAVASADDASGASAVTTPPSPAATLAAGTHPDWGVFTTGALTVGVAYTISIVFSGLGDYYGYSGFLAIPLAGGAVYASFDELHPEARWRGALLSASQALGLVVWIVGMVIDIPDASPSSPRLGAGVGDLGLSLTLTL